MARAAITNANFIDGRHDQKSGRHYLATVWEAARDIGCAVIA